MPSREELEAWSCSGVARGLTSALTGSSAVMGEPVCTGRELEDCPADLRIDAVLNNLRSESENDSERFLALAASVIARM